MTRYSSDIAWFSSLALLWRLDTNSPRFLLSRYKSEDDVHLVKVSSRAKESLTSGNDLKVNSLIGREGSVKRQRTSVLS